MRNTYPLIKSLLFTFLFINCLSFSLFGQNLEQEILESYQKFSSPLKEVVYVHINKSVFIKNETIGFTAYVFDKSNKTPSIESKNLYCTITSKNGEIIKQKLLKIENGIAYNTFDIDDKFKSGEYTFRAYTNWMLNFKEANYYEQTFVVLENEVKKENTTNKYTIQALPEGGHLVVNTKNTLGIIVKNSKGIGLQNAKGKLVDENNTTFLEFTLNEFGIAKVSFTPKLKKNYKVIVNNENEKLIKPINNIKEKGISLSVYNLRDKLGLSIRTNKETIIEISNKIYLIVIHNGKNLKTVPFSFKNNLEVSKFINLKDLYKGVNIITVFDVSKKKPLLERLLFNTTGINKTQITSVNTKTEKDSINFKLKLDNKIDFEKIQNLSISVLPSNTKSYTNNSNILSKIYLEPYVKGFIQNAAYYFSSNSQKVTYNLDHLLITQGWSSYSWDDIFETNKVYNYKFEQGISLVANIQDKVKKGFLVYPLKNNKTEIFIPNEKDKAFLQNNLYPEDLEKYRVSLLKKRSRTSKPKLYLQFYPNKIPDFNVKSNKINSYKINPIYKGNNSKIPKIKSSKIEFLDEVIVKTSLERQRIEKIKRKAYGRIEVFTDENSKNILSLGMYLTSKGVNFKSLLLLNNAPVVDNSIIYGLPFNMIESVEIFRTGNSARYAYGPKAEPGLIKVKTKSNKEFLKSLNSSKNEVGIYDFPLTFSTPKKYYSPIYQNYYSKFFKEYGVIDWLPNLKVSKNGELSFKIRDTFTETVKLYVEGLVNDNSLVSEIKTINIKK